MKGSKLMPEWLILPLILIGYLLLVRHVLPRLGVPT
jgi:hypothetical protein